MLSDKELLKIRNLLEESQNPIFFYDNDGDGLTSFLLLSRFIGRGKGIAIKSYPGLGNMYIHKLREMKCDSVFILDKPVVDPAFLEATKQLGLNVIWIDHHTPQEKEFVEDIEYFNPLNGEEPTSEPVSYWCYQATKKKADEWIALVGCISDYYVPNFAKDFADKFSDLISYSTNPADMLFNSQLGKLAKILAFSLKDSTTNVLRMVRFMLQTTTPYDLLNREGREAEFIYTRFERINRKYAKLIEKTKESGAKSGRVLFFSYGGDLSISAEVSNETQYFFPDKLIVIAYNAGEKINISLRDNHIDLREFLEKVMEDIEGSYGGHKAACGASISANDFEKFKESVENQIKNL